ncbi:uncharacterized protein [Amphiura filiformis]|uniref:uncharacterized protein n=1 Tax=Amphiura filiformis TaxID=82378 RepID=UPI003B21F44D
MIFFALFVRSKPSDDSNGEARSESSDSNSGAPSDSNGEPPSDSNGEPPSDSNGEPPSDSNGEPPSDSNIEASSESFESPANVDQISKFIGPEEGTLGFDDNIAQLSIPPGALEKPTQITLSIVSPETDHPPLGDKFIIAPIVRLEPDGLQFLRPVTLTLKHAAVDLTLKNLEVWTKTAGRWQLDYDGETGNNANTFLSKDVVKIRMAHFCIKCILGRSKLRVKILPYIPVDLRRSKEIGLTVYALKSFHVKNIEAEMAAMNHVRCLDSAAQVYDIPRHKMLEIDLTEVKDKNSNMDVWEVPETPLNIHAESINKGPGNAYCRFMLTPKDDKVDSIIATLNVQRKPNDPDVIKVYILHIMEDVSQHKKAGQLLPAAAAAAETTDSGASSSTSVTAASWTSPHARCRRDDQTPSSKPIKMFNLILDDAKDILHDNLNTNNILMRLKSRDVLSDEEVAEINNIHGLGERVNMLLAILKTKDVNAYDEFMSALREFDHDLYCEVKKIERKYPYRL